MVRVFLVSRMFQAAEVSSFQGFKPLAYRNLHWVSTALPKKDMMPWRLEGTPVPCGHSIHVQMIFPYPSISIIHLRIHGDLSKRRLTIKKRKLPYKSEKEKLRFFCIPLGPLSKQTHFRSSHGHVCLPEMARRSQHNQ